MPDDRNDSEAAPLEPLSVLDRLLEHRARLPICVLLSKERRFSFRRLKELLGETDGSLGAHLRKLENAGYLSVSKEFVDRKPVSWYRLETKGRQALKRHLDGLSRLIEESRTGE